MRHLGLICIVVGLVLSCSTVCHGQQPPMGEDGLSFRADAFFPTGDDFISATGEPIVGVRWWGSIAEEAVPHEPRTSVPFTISFYSSSGGLPGTSLASYSVDAVETWTGGFCRGIEGLGGGDVCVGPEPLYSYEVCLDGDVMFGPKSGVEYWLVITNTDSPEAHFWSWHETELPHPTGNEAATWGFSDFVPGLINACPGDFAFTVGPYDLAFELLLDCAEATTPDDFNAFRGFYDSGDLDSLLESDDDKLCYNPGIVLSPAEAPVTLDFLGTLPNDSPGSLDVTIESSANTVGLELTFSFWNYNTNTWDVVGTAAQSLNADTVRTFAGNPTDHVELGTGEVRTRYEVRVVSFIFVFPWLDCVDHVYWTTS